MTETATKRAHTIWASNANESDELLRLAVQVGGIGIYETDLERKRTRFSPELCVILGLPAGTEMDYADASRLVDERDRAAVNAIMEAARNASDEGTWNSVHRIVRPDGTVRWISVNGRRYYRETTKGRQAVRSIGTVIDVTHLKETEDALRQSELRLRFALEAAQMGTFEVEIGGTKPSSMHRRPICSACRKIHGSFPSMSCARAYLWRTCRRVMPRRSVWSSMMKDTTMSCASACRMGPNAGSALMRPSGQAASSA